MIKKQRIGIYGGTFNPPHAGHVGAALGFLNAVELDELLIMPAFLPPHKEFVSTVSTEDRLTMADLAFSDIEKATVSDLEIKRGGKSYTALTLEELSSPDRELYFLCGTDMILTMDQWYCPERIFELATICYVRRETDIENDTKISEKTNEYIKKFNARIIPVPLSVTDVSSSELREKLASREYAGELLPRSVYEYILEKGLYK